MMAGMTVKFDVKDAEQLTFIIKQIRRVRGVVDVYRISG